MFNNCVLFFSAKIRQSVLLPRISIGWVSWLENCWFGRVVAADVAAAVDAANSVADVAANVVADTAVCNWSEGHYSFGGISTFLHTSAICFAILLDSQRNCGCWLFIKRQTSSCTFMLCIHSEHQPISNYICSKSESTSKRCVCIFPLLLLIENN